MNKQNERTLAFAFGVVFIVTLIGLALFVPNPTPFQYTVFRIVLALAAAGVAVTFTGFIEITIPSWIKAGGALAVFAIVFFYNPASLITSSKQTNPTSDANESRADSNDATRPGKTAKEDPVVPPDRLLAASPFRVRLDDCTGRSCDVKLYVRGYDPKGRLRYDASERFNNWITGQFRDTFFNTPDKIYFEAKEKVSFQSYCRLGNGPLLVGESTELDWKAWNESGTPGYSSWLSCGNNDFKASIGIGVSIATFRVNEPAVKNEINPPGE